MKSQLDRKLIEGLKESNNQEFLGTVNDFVYGLMSSVVSDISAKSPFVRSEKCVLQPVNEVYTGAFCQLSQYSYFLAIENPQLETNSKKAKVLWKNIWREFRASWRIGRKKKYRKEKETTIVNVDKYQIGDFRHDVMKRSLDYLSATTVVTEYPDCITFMGNEDFGTNVVVNVYVCCYDSETGVFKLPLSKRNKFLNIDFGNRFLNIEEKKKVVGDGFVDMIKIFNALYSQTYNNIPNQILLESLIFNCPNLLFDNKDVYKTFLNVANYIRISDPQSFRSICDESRSVFNEVLVTKSTDQVEFNKIVSMLDNFKF